MNKFKLFSLFIIFFSLGCNTPGANIDASPSITASASINQPQDQKTNPVVTATPSPVISPSHLQPSLLPSVSPLPQSTENRIFLSGIGRMFSSVTDQVTTDETKDIRIISEQIDELNPNFIVIDFRQQLIDSDINGKVDGNDKGWSIYENIFNQIKDKNSEIIFNVKFLEIPNNITKPSLGDYKIFLEQAVKHYNSPKISWMIGEKINESPVKQNEYLDLIRESYNTIKSVSPNIPVYSGSFSQSEVFGKPLNYMAENLLSYINLGIGKYCDGFVLEFYALSPSATPNTSDDVFSKANYRFIPEYYKSIKDVLERKNLKDKKLFLSTGTFSGDIVGGIYQSDQEQSNYNFRSLVYGMISGFDKVYIPRLMDEKSDNVSNFFNKSGLITEKKGEITESTKKSAYWSYKLTSNKLNGAVYKKRIDGLPKNIEGFIFEKNNKPLYVIWNDNIDRADLNLYGTVSINVEGKNGKIYILPYGSETGFVESNFSLQNGQKSINLYFNTNMLVPKIIEILE